MSGSPQSPIEKLRNLSLQAELGIDFECSLPEELKTNSKKEKSDDVPHAMSAPTVALSETVSHMDTDLSRKVCRAMTAEPVLYGQLPFIYSDANDVFEELPSIQKLTDTVRERGDIAEEDTALFRQILAEIRDMDSLDSTIALCELDENPGNMRRMCLYYNDFFNIRVHFWDNNAHDQRPHDHAQNMIAICLRGGYRTEFWEVDRAANDLLFIVDRLSGGIRKDKKPIKGKMKEIRRVQVGEHGAIWYQKDMIHSVCHRHTQKNSITIVLKSNVNKKKHISIYNAERMDDVEIFKIVDPERKLKAPCVRNLCKALSDFPDPEESISQKTVLKTQAPPL